MEPQIELLPTIPGSYMNSNSRSSCSTSNLAAYVPRKTAEDGPTTQTHEPTWDTWLKLSDTGFSLALPQLLGLLGTELILDIYSLSLFLALLTYSNTSFQTKKYIFKTRLRMEMKMILNALCWPLMGKSAVCISLVHGSVADELDGPSFCSFLMSKHVCPSMK